MEISVTIGGGQTMTLSGAVLVYQGGREAFAVWHPAKPGPNDGAPYLGEAEPLTMEFLTHAVDWAGSICGAGSPARIGPGSHVRAYGVVGAGAAPRPLLWRTQPGRKRLELQAVPNTAIGVQSGGWKPLGPRVGQR